MTDSDLKARAEGISFQQCRLFESVGRLENVRRCAEECNLSQPAVTQAMSKLEQQVECLLLDRKSDGTYLTAMGRILHARVRRLLKLTETALTGLGIGPHFTATIANRLSKSQVRCLVAVAQSGSLAKAAQDLGLTTASMNRAVRQLESNLGRPLFYRTARGIMLTPEGVELAREFKLASLEIEMGLREINDSRGVQTSQIVLGTLPYGGSMLLASVLDRFTHQYPDTGIRILTEGANEMMRRLRFGDVDLVVGIVQETASADLAHEIFSHTEFLVVARAGHPLFGRASVTIDDLAAFDWILGLEGSSRRLCLDKLFLGHVLPRAPVETSTLTIIRQLIMDSDRLTLMTDYELHHESHALVRLPFASIPARPAVGITMRKDWLPTRIHADFIDLMRTTLEQGSSAKTARTT